MSQAKAESRHRIRIAGVMRVRDRMLNSFWNDMQRALVRIPGCVFQRFDSTTQFEDALAWQPDGIVVHINREDMVEPLKRSGIPIVNTSAIFGDLPFSSVLPDNVAVGRMAGEHLIAKGYRAFGYMGQDLRYARDRLQGFCDGVGVEPERMQWFPHRIEDGDHVAEGELSESARSAIRWLDALPDHTGLCLCDDRYGYHLTEAMRRIDFNLLDRFGIVTCHDRNAPTNPSLSGVQLPEERWAYSAALLLTDIVRGRIPGDQSLRLQPLGVIERESTAQLSVSDPILREAVQYIANHAGEPITVADVAAAVHLGRRALEKRFKRGLGKTMLTEIHRTRVEWAKRLLIETDRSLYTVAVDAGLSDEKHLRRLFAKYVGMTPSAFRDQYRMR